MTPVGRQEKIEAAIVRLLNERSAEASICPSEVARNLAGDAGPWRPLMEPVRAAAARMAGRGVVRVTQGKDEVDLSLPVKGPVRIRRGAAWN